MKATLSALTVTLPVTVTVLDNLGMPHAGIRVYAFNGSSYTGFNGTTNADGQVTLTLPQQILRGREPVAPKQMATAE
jgi:hypothetical protein